MLLRYPFFLSTLLLSCFFVGRVDSNAKNLERIAKRTLEFDTDPYNLFSSAFDTEANEFYYTQALDHFSSPITNSTPEVFQQRYFVNDTMWNKANGPVFLIIGSSEALTGESVSTGEVVYLAQEYNALVISLEHRYYGESVPFSDLSTNNLAYLSVQQALADIAQFKAAMLQTYQVPLASPWITFGCFYSGSLSAWFRLKFPHLINAALASSSPVEATDSFYQYDTSVSQILGPTCSSALRNATQQIQSQLQINNLGIKTLFNCTSINDDIAFLYVIADMVAFAVQYNSTFGLAPYFCNTIVNSSNSIASYATYVNYLLEYTHTTASMWDISSFVNTTNDVDNQMRQWMWQLCSQLGYFQTAPSSNSLRSPLITSQWHEGVCGKLFWESESEMQPQVQWINEYYGGIDIQSSRTLFINGANDPWKYLSVMSNGKGSDVLDSMRSIVISGASQCANCNSPSPSDSSSVISARNLISDYVGAFIKPSLADMCVESCNGDHGSCSILVSDSALFPVCKCFSNYLGPSCRDKETPHSEVNWWVVVLVAIGCLSLGAGVGWFFSSKSMRSKYFEIP
eukprot:TRINITY_DN4005_c0_g5_i1.p1 TRINITY_DN4005_c0_g5~~TRINITY_DN4005_c0_g5_i1.p1  ORF type:complete len:571 (-),score=58.81 TRINITY_DN4005_c0_g5_i1:106-1818(-)